MPELKINPKIKDLLLLICRDLFLGLFALFAVFNVMEFFKPRIVLNYINLDWFLLALIILGLIIIFYYPEPVKELKKLDFWSRLTIILVAILSGILAIYLTKEIGYLSTLVGIASSIISYYFINLCFKE